MYNIIPLILILVSLIIIIAIVFKKFSLLATLDIENIPSEKEAKFKERIIGARLKRNIIKWWSQFFRFIVPIATALNSLFDLLYKKLQKLKNDYLKPKSDLDLGDIKTKIDQYFDEAIALKKQDDLVAAEKKYIEIIGIDSKNIRAFKDLGGLYFEQKSFEEAKQAFEHVLKLKQDSEDILDYSAQITEKCDNKDSCVKVLDANKQDAQIFYDLALVYQELNNLPEAINNLKKALKIEPNNPRFLDTMLELSIITKDKILALDAFNKLVEVNPENKKIELFKKQIRKI